LKERIIQKARALKNELSAISLAVNDKRTPFAAKIMIALTIGYALSPIDLIPDFIPVLGYLDDIIILPLMILIVLKLIPKEVMEECRLRAKVENNLNKKAGIFIAALIILLWLILIILLLFGIGVI
jgi:uncharacterized membrane protein YkvA (DUF1232 family)